MTWRARPNIFECEQAGETILTADQCTGLGFEKEIIEEPMADGNDEALDGNMKLTRFRMHVQQPEHFANFWTWFNTPWSEPIDFAVHRKNLKGTIIQTIELQGVKPVRGEVDDFNRRTKTEIQGHWIDMIGRVTGVSKF